MLRPLSATSWNYSTAAHLLNRAGFGGLPGEIEKLAAMSPGEAVASLVDFQKIPDNADPPPAWAKPDPERVEKVKNLLRMRKENDDSTKTPEEKREFYDKQREMIQQYRREEYQDIQGMRYDWLKRMATTSRPFQEKLTLFWHGHFATSVAKVKEPYFMWLQIDTFRQKGTGNWLDLLEAVATDPAMLIWLDQALSRRQHPNENFARESMELFTLGEGHYTEKDVTEAARAMTGWSLDRIHQQYVYRERLHDDGVKTILGKVGNFDGRDVLEIIVQQPQAARFITKKLWQFFASDNPSDKLIDAMADEFRSGGNNFAPFLKTMLASEEFYAADVMHTQIKSPVQWLVNSVRLLQRNMLPPIVSTQMTRTLGQDLLAPPNVKGWDGGLSWITTNTLLARYNQAAILVMGRGNLGAEGDKAAKKRIAERANQAANMLRPANVSDIISDSERGDKAKVMATLEKQFIQSQLTEAHRQVLRDYLEPLNELTDQDIRHAIRLLMSTPEYQVT